MRTATGWLRQCESQKLANDTARLEEEMNRDDCHEFECEICRTTFLVPIDQYEGQWDHPPNVTTCPKCEEGAIGESLDPNDDGDYAYDCMKDREASR